MQISNLIVEVDEFLGLLLNEQRSVGDVEFHDGFLLIVNAFEVAHLVFGPVLPILPSLLEFEGIIREGRGLLDSLRQSELFDCSDVILVAGLNFLGHLFGLLCPCLGNHGIMLFGCWWVWFLFDQQVFVESL